MSHMHNLIVCESIYKLFDKISNIKEIELIKIIQILRIYSLKFRTNILMFRSWLNQLYHKLNFVRPPYQSKFKIDKQHFFFCKNPLWKSIIISNQFQYT